MKAAALELEDNVRSIDFDWWTDETVDLDEAKRCFNLMLDDAYADRHSHRFRKAFDRVCRDLNRVWEFRTVGRYLKEIKDGPIPGAKILSGYDDLAGLFVIRGDTYTLIKHDKIPQHITFDSFGSEGLKLRVLGVVSDNKQRSRGKRR